MIRMRSIRRLFEARTREAMQSGTDMAGYRRGAVEFLREWHETFGVKIHTDGGSLRPGFYKRGDGIGYKPANTAHANEVSIRHLAEALLGHDFVEEFYHPSAGIDFGSRNLLEAAIDPTSFLNVSLFNLSVAGLVNAEIIEHYDKPDYIGRELVTVKPTNMNGQKLIGTAEFNPQDKDAKWRKPGQTHAEIGFTEKYQTTPETVEQALKVVVTREAVYFDYTGQVNETAGQIGDILAYGQEQNIADEVMGVTNSYNFTGTSYNTYQTSSPWINDQSNAYTDETSVDSARQLFVGMTDPVTGREIVIRGYHLLAMPAKELLIRQTLFGTNVDIGTTQTAANFPLRRTLSTPGVVGQLGGANQMYQLTPLTSIWYNRATAADGLNLSASNAKLYWWVGDYKRAFWWMENWPLTPWNASADELTMKDRGLVAVYGANYRGQIYTREPRYVVRNKN